MKFYEDEMVFIRIFLVYCLVSLSSSTFAKGTAMPSRITAYDGKSFAGFQDPEYLSYDQALREYLVKRIDQAIWNCS